MEVDANTSTGTSSRGVGVHYKAIVQMNGSRGDECLGHVSHMLVGHTYVVSPERSRSSISDLRPIVPWAGSALRPDFSSNNKKKINKIYMSLWFVLKRPKMALKKRL